MMLQKHWVYQRYKIQQYITKKATLSRGFHYALGKLKTIEFRRLLHGYMGTIHQFVTHQGYVKLR